MATVIQPRRLSVRKTIFVGSVLIAFFVYTYFIRDPRIASVPPIVGRTMGTTYQVKIANSSMTMRQHRDISSDIESLLADLNRQMSTYITDSQISQFNESRSTEPVEIAVAFGRVASYARALAEETAGAFDPTLGPLIQRWGFGHTEPGTTALSAEEISALKQHCGYTNLVIVSEKEIRKSIPELELNLSAVAKGYAVDAVMLHLTRKGLRHLYVEIGGETRVLGMNQDGIPWLIGLEYPAEDLAPGEALAAILSGTNMSVATSGDYRNQYVDENGITRNHILDPRTGEPITNRVASATVIAPRCMTADGAATALMVIGPEAGIRWIESAENIEAFILVRGEDGDLNVFESSGFKRYATEVFVAE
jgi:thiamine biosynthesis lipoprotein